MSWNDDPRGATAVRQVAHSDDAKHRADETHRVVRRPPLGRLARVPVLAAGVLVVLVGSGTTAALVAARSGHPKPADADPAKQRAAGNQAVAASASPTSAIDSTTGASDAGPFYAEGRIVAVYTRISTGKSRTERYPAKVYLDCSRTTSCQLGSPGSSEYRILAAVGEGHWHADGKTPRVVGSCSITRSASDVDLTIADAVRIVWTDAGLERHTGACLASAPDVVTTFTGKRTAQPVS